VRREVAAIKRGNCSTTVSRRKAVSADTYVGDAIIKKLLCKVSRTQSCKDDSAALLGISMASLLSLID
jgi:hypothetical protein